MGSGVSAGAVARRVHHKQVDSLAAGGDHTHRLFFYSVPDPEGGGRHQQKVLGRRKSTLASDLLTPVTPDTLRGWDLSETTVSVWDMGC